MVTVRQRKHYMYFFCSHLKPYLIVTAYELDVVCLPLPLNCHFCFDSQAIKKAERKDTFTVGMWKSTFGHHLVTSTTTTIKASANKSKNIRWMDELDAWMEGETKGDVGCCIAVAARELIQQN